MINTLRVNFRDPMRRRYVAARLGGKMIGVAIVMALIYGLSWYFSTHAGASVVGQAAIKATDVINPLNTVWVLVTAFLVFFMQAGFMMLEGGFARTREVSNIMIECIVDTGLCGILFYAFGFAFMFGPGNGWIGYHFFFLQGVPHTYGTTGVAFMAFWLFQFAFADTASTIVSGAMVGRTAFKGDLFYSIAVSGFIYPIFGHWVWGPNGWLATMDTPFRDFAGSTVVHTIGGVLAICGAIALGPRLGRKFKRDGGGMPPGHNMTLAALGARDPVVRVVRLQPRQHALGDGLRRHRPHRHEHDACRVRRRPRRGRLGLPEIEEVRRRHQHQRTARRSRGDHVSVLLGLANWSDRHRCDRRCGHDHRRRPHRVVPGRRPLRSVRSARRVRDLGNPEPRALRRRQLRPPGSVGLRHDRREGDRSVLRRQRQSDGGAAQGERDDHRLHRWPPGCW